MRITKRVPVLATLAVAAASVVTAAHGFEREKFGVSGGDVDDVRFEMSGSLS